MGDGRRDKGRGAGETRGAEPSRGRRIFPSLRAKEVPLVVSDLCCQFNFTGALELALRFIVEHTWFKSLTRYECLYFYKFILGFNWCCHYFSDRRLFVDNNMRI